MFGVVLILAWMDPVELTSPVIAVKQFKTKIERGTEIASIDYDHDRL